MNGFASWAKANIRVCESQREEIGYQRNKQILKQIYPRDIPSSALTWSGNPFWQKMKISATCTRKQRRERGTLDLMWMFLCSVTTRTTYWRKLPYLGMSTGCRATHKLQAMRWSGTGRRNAVSWGKLYSGFYFWLFSVHRNFARRKDISLVISLDDSREQQAAESTYFLQLLYLLCNYRILRKSFLVLRSFAKVVHQQQQQKKSSSELPPLSQASERNCPWCLWGTTPRSPRVSSPCTLPPTATKRPQFFHLSVLTL